MRGFVNQMNCFLNAIKVDKVRIWYERDNIEPFTRLEIEKQFGKYYPDYIPTTEKGRTIYNFTPMKLFNEHNLQMPSENKFDKFLDDITLEREDIQELLGVSVLHLTKDVILSQPVDNYIQMLNLKTYSRLDNELIESEGISSLYLHYRINEYSENPIKYRIKFYNKSAEYYKRHKTYIARFNEDLTREEIEELGDAYNAKDKTVNLEKINLLRCEIELKGADKLRVLALSNEPLTLSVLKQMTLSGTLYNHLNQAFTHILTDKVFTAKNDIDSVIDGEAKIFKPVLEQLLNSPNLWVYRAIANELGYRESFGEIERKLNEIVPDSDLYSELCNKLVGTDSNNNTSHEVTVIPREQVINHCNSSEVKEYCLAYEVPIFDDS